MPSNDNRYKYFRHNIQAAQEFNAKQSFLDEYPIVKTPATDETEALYYTEADGLSHFDAIKLSMPGRVAFIEDDLVSVPTNHGTMSDNEQIPAGSNYILYAFPNIMTGKLERDMWKQWEEANDYFMSLGEQSMNPNHFLLAAPKTGHSEYLDYVNNGNLPE